MILFNNIMLLSGKSPKPASDKFFTRKLMNLLSLIGPAPSGPSGSGPAGP